MAIDDGGPAFPQAVQIQSHPGEFTYAPQMPSGMSLRDYFAAQAIQRIEIDNDESPETQPTEEMYLWIEWQATYAYAVADAMLKAREERRQHDDDTEAASLVPRDGPGDTEPGL